jgi:hypothetical protein
MASAADATVTVSGGVSVARTLLLRPHGYQTARAILAEVLPARDLSSLHRDDVTDADAERHADLATPLVCVNTTTRSPTSMMSSM